MAQDGMYFVSKKDLLQWINTTLDLNITKIEQARKEEIHHFSLSAIRPKGLMSSTSFLLFEKSKLTCVSFPDRQVQEP